MNRVDEIKAEIEKLNEELRTIQRECSHPKSCRKMMWKSEKCRMNYDLQEYELEANIEHWHCSLCGTDWTVTKRV